jgi:hypothetical protein
VACQSAKEWEGKLIAHQQVREDYQCFYNQQLLQLSTSECGIAQQKVFGQGPKSSRHPWSDRTLTIHLNISNTHITTTGAALISVVLAEVT